MAIYTFIFFLLKGDDPEVAILGCATKTTQFQVNTPHLTIFKDNIQIRYVVFCGLPNNAVDFSKKSSEILNEYFYSHLSNPYPRWKQDAMVLSIKTLVPHCIGCANMNNAANDNDNADDYFNGNGISIQYITVRRPRKN